MKVFVTGGSGFVGSAVVSNLMTAGHEVLGLARSKASAEALNAAGAEVIQGDLDDVRNLRDGASQCEGVIHCAFGNDFSKLLASSAQDSKAIEAIGSELAGSDRPLIVTSVVMMGIPAPGQLAVESFFDRSNPNPMRLTEIAGANVADQGVNVSVVRLPQVHDRIKQAIPELMRQIAHGKRVSAYVGNGSNRWAAGHILDVALLYRLALERRRAGSIYHAVGEEGVSLKSIAEMIGKKLEIPVISMSPAEAQTHFGPLAMLVGMDLSTSSALTKQALNWHPAGPGLLSDLESAQ